MAQAPPSFASSFTRLFKHSLELRNQTWQQQQDDSKMEQDSLDENDASFFCSLRTLGWIRRGACLTQALGQAIHNEIHKHVSSTIKGEFEEELFESVQAWKDAIVVRT